MNKLKAVVLAAGKGTRMRVDGSDLPKVMRKALGKPLLGYVLDALPVEQTDIILVVGYKRELVTAAYPRCAAAVQLEQLGTGHAVQCAAPMLQGFSGNVLICCGDMPLVRSETYKALVNEHSTYKNDCTILSGRSQRELPYGRVLRNADGGFLRIVEDRDCAPEEKAVRELNSGVYVFDCQKLLSALTGLRSENNQKEYYLTDVPGLMLSRGDRVGVCVRDMNEELIGVNTPEQLHEVEELLSAR